MAKKVETGIWEREPGVFDVRVHVARDPRTGKIKQVTRTTREGIQAARRLRAKLITEVAQGKYGGTASTLGVLFDEWHKHKKRMGNAETTLAEERRKIDNNIRPYLGDKHLDKLTSHDLDRFYADSLGRGRGAHTVLHFHRIIHAALQQAFLWGWVEKNVADRATPPSYTKRKKTVPMPAEVQAIITEAGKSRNKEMAGLITVGAMTGMRDGELCGLQFLAVDMDQDLVEVKLAVWQVGAEWGTKLPKSHQVRTLAVPELVTAVVRHRWELLVDAADLLEVGLPEDAFVWSIDPLGQVPYLPKSVGQAFRRIRDRAGVNARLHDLRGFAGTEMIKAGVNPRTVADRLGHADPSTTLRIYTAGREESDRSAAEALGQLLAPREDPQ